MASVIDGSGYRWLGLVALAGLLVGLGGCEDTAAVTSPGTSAVAVRVADVVAAPDAEPLRFAGSARAQQRASLTFQVGGVLATRPLQIGQQVASGEVLATLYNPQLEPARDAARARLAELQAQAGQAQRDLERVEQLYQRGVLSEQAREQQRAQLEAINASVRSARASLQQSEQLNRESVLRAPFAGSIENLLVEPGEFITAGQPVLQMAAGSGMEVEIMVPAALLEGLVVGAPLPVWSTLDNRELIGRIAEIGRGASQGSVLYPLVVSLEADVQSGAALEVGLAHAASSQLTVPLASIMRSAQGVSVFRIRNGQAERVSIAVASLQGERALLAGDSLQPGDQVVYAGLSRLAEGDAVELLQ
ncbi:MAG: efflux RND transporter periplasmic adaptor subunit [Halopseudomonas sp.]|uniref:efflux RND transporter periplasmic adaptor subunit n=1 Tax=Halopseudomonas sp. TaxID=2901191 RepID=UPI00300180BB